MSTTFITSIYTKLTDGSIGRWERYTLSLKSIAKCGAYFVVYTSPEEYDELKSFIQYNVPSPEKIDIRPEPISNSKWNNVFSKLYSLGYRSGQRSMNLVHSKMEWLSKVAAENPFSTTHFFFFFFCQSVEGLFPKWFLRDDQHTTFEKYTDYSVFNPDWLSRLETESSEKMWMIAMTDQVMLWNAPLDRKFYNENAQYGRFHVIGGLFGSSSSECLSWFESECSMLLNAVLADYPMDRFLPVEELIYTAVVENHQDKIKLNMFDTWYHEDHEPCFDTYKRGKSFHQLFL